MSRATRRQATALCARTGGSRWRSAGWLVGAVTPRGAQRIVDGGLRSRVVECAPDSESGGAAAHSSLGSYVSP